MASLQKIIKVTKAQYQTLSSGGTVGSYTGLDPNYIYLVEDDGGDFHPVIDIDGGLTASIRAQVQESPNALLRLGEYLYVPNYQSNDSDFGIPTYYSCFAVDEKVAKWLEIDWNMLTTQGSSRSIPSSDDIKNGAFNIIAGGSTASSFTANQSTTENLTIAGSGGTTVTAGISQLTISSPAVNNGTLTIQRNGTQVATFTANQSGNSTANITVPTVPTTTTANKMLVSTSTSDSPKWSDWSSAGLLKTNSSGVISVDTNSYLTSESDTLSTVLNRGNTANKDIDLNYHDFFNAGVQKTTYNYSTSQDPQTQYWWYQIIPPSGSQSDRYLICVEGDENYPRGRGTFILDVSKYSTNSYNVSLNNVGSTMWGDTHLLKCAMDSSGNVYIQANAAWSSYLRFIRHNSNSTTQAYTQIGKAAFGTANGFTSVKMITDCGTIRLYNGSIDTSSSNSGFTSVDAEKFREGGSYLADKYLGKTAKAADADKLDGQDSPYYLNYNNFTNTPTLGTAASKNSTTSVTQNSADLVTSGAVWSAIDNLPEPMVFKGTLGTGGTITSLPAAASGNEGYTYKVITAGTYQSIACKVGDVVVSNGTAWVLIPAGDTDTDTWRNVKVNGTELLGTAISTGAVNFKNGSNVTISGSGNDITISASQPTVNNGTLTIQGNGTAATTFTANQSGNSTLNIKGSGGTTVTKSADNEITVSTPSVTDTNQTVKVGTTTFGPNDAVGIVAGTNITSITADTSAKTITINAQDTTYSDATTSASGLMSSTDKKKLDFTSTVYQVDSVTRPNSTYTSNYVVYHITVPEITSLYEGLRVRVSLGPSANWPNNSGGALKLLQINNLTPIALFWRYNSMATWNNFDGAIMTLTYTATARPTTGDYYSYTSKAGFMLDFTYDSGNDTYTLQDYGGYITDSTAIQQYTFVGFNADGKRIPLIQTNGTLTNLPFIYGRGIEYYDGGTRTANTTYSGWNGTFVRVAVSRTLAAGFVSAYGLGTVTTATRLYAKCSKSGITMTCVGFTTTLPSTEDGYYYIFLGRPYQAYTNTTGSEQWIFSLNQPIFYYNDGSLQMLDDNTYAENSAKLGGQAASYYLNYNNLTNKPTIPTVNNATLTIQKNGTTVKTFTANASTDVTANITVPTSAGTLTGTTTVNTSSHTHGVTITPSSTNVVTGTYDSSTGILNLTTVSALTGVTASTSASTSTTTVASNSHTHTLS